jgi:hypothetical protein
MSNKINWSDLFQQYGNIKVWAEFCDGTLSGRQLYAHFVNTKLGGSVRNLLRTLGVDQTRKLAKRALARRRCYYSSLA